MGIITSLFKREPKPLKLDPNQKYNCPSATIVYGTKTGNAQLVAQQLQKTCEQNGIDSECYNIAKYNLARIFSEKLLLIVMSTDGEGEVPPNSRQFFGNINNPDFPELSKLNYSICALGDSSYEYFCGAGKLIESRLDQLNANAVLPRVDCDLDFKESALGWIESAFLYLKNQSTAPIKAESESPSINLEIPEMLQTTLIQRAILTKGKKEKATYHVVLDNSNHQIKYQSGDCIEVIPENPDKLVSKIVEALKIDARQPINGGGHAIYDLLKYKFELTRLTRKVVRNYQVVTSNESALNLINNKENLKRYVESKDVLDLLNDFPSNISGEALVKVLIPLHSRYYSIASGYEAHPNEIHLTIKTIRFEYQNRQYLGAASTFINEGLSEGSKIHFRLIPNNTFHLPETKQSPVVLIGVGTGIAPYIGFLQDKQAKGIGSKTWLIWGDKKRSEDFLYENELNQFLSEGILSDLDTCFSRDQDEKVYVQHVIKEKAIEMMQWIDNGAHIYLCGHTRMGRDVRNTLSDIIMKFRNLSKQEANQEIIRMQEESILHEDLY